MKNLFHVSTAVLLLALCPAKLLMAGDITACTTIDVPNALNTIAARVNNFGQIVGGYQAADGSFHGFLYSGGVFSTIDDPSAASGSEVTSINNLGQMIGAYNLMAVEGHQLEGAHGFTRNGSTFTNIDFPASGVIDTTPAKNNDLGTIVGVYRISTISGFSAGIGFIDTGGVLSTLNVPASLGCCTHNNGMNNAGEIVGQYKYPDASGPHHGFLNNGGTYTTVDFPGAVDSRATDINNVNNIVGGYSLSSGGKLGFLDQGGNFSTIACSAGVSTEPFGINDYGNIVGTYQDQNGAFHGFEANFPAAPKLFVDVRPQSCPNPINIGARGSLPVAILGTASFNVTTVDPSSVKLQGVPALRSALEDISRPFTGSFANANSCTTAGPDGFQDLVFIFSNQAVSAALGSVTNGQVLVLTLTGNLLPQFGGTPITGQDVVVVSKQ